MKQKKTKANRQVVTAEDAERMYAQAWPTKEEQIRAEAEAVLKGAEPILEAIGQRHGVIIRAQTTIVILPAFLAGPVQAKLPTPGA